MLSKYLRQLIGQLVEILPDLICRPDSSLKYSDRKALLPGKGYSQTAIYKTRR